MLTHKERYLKAVHLEIPDMIPVDGTNLDLIHAQTIARAKGDTFDVHNGNFL